MQKDVQKESANLKKQNYEPKGVGSSQDVISKKDWKRLGQYFWKLNRHYNYLIYSLAGLKMRAELIMSHTLTCRSQLLRILLLSDIGTKFYESEGINGSTAITFNFDQSKMNHVGKKEKAGCFRHQNVAECVFNALALYTFDRLLDIN